MLATHSGPITGGAARSMLQTRPDPVTVPQRPLEADRSPDVVEDEVAALDPETIDRLARPASQSGPAVVEGLRFLGEAEARQIEGDAAQPALSEQR